MAATVGELVVNLKARTGAFSKGMQASGRQVTTFGSRVGAAAKRVVAFGGAMLGVASVGGIAIMIKRNLALMDATGKLADRIGITTEALQGLRHAAELTGAGADTLDAGLTTMSKRLGEAARGAGAATPALKLLGLDIKDIIALSPDQQFIALAEAIAKLPTATERAAAAANIFSKGNMALINTLQEGRAGLAAMQAEAELLGKTFSRETAAKAEAANDAIERLSASMSGAAVQATADLAGEIENLANAMAKIPSLARDFRGNLLRWIATSQEAFLNQNGGISPEWAEWIEQMRISGGQMDEGSQGRGSRASRAKKRAARMAAQVAAEKAKEAMLATPFMMPGVTAPNIKAQAALDQGFEEQRRMWEQAAASRTANIRNMISGAMGGDGASLQLSGADVRGSAGAYSAMVRHGLAGTAKKTDEQILGIVKEQLRTDKDRNRKLDELLAKLGDEQDVKWEIR